MPVSNAPGSSTTKAVEREFVITRDFDAPRSLVFLAWTKPEHLVQWWGRKAFTNCFCEMDVRPGGAFRICMRSPGGRDFWVKGSYHEIVEPERIVFTCLAAYVAAKSKEQAS